MQFPWKPEIISIEHLREIWELKIVYVCKKMIVVLFGGIWASVVKKKWNKEQMC